jgi:hypothetical protein
VDAAEVTVTGEVMATPRRLSTEGLDS